MTLRHIGHQEPFFSLGQLPTADAQAAIRYANGLYTIVGDRLQLQFDGERVVASPCLAKGSPARWNSSRPSATLCGACRPPSSNTPTTWSRAA